MTWEEAHLSAIRAGQRVAALVRFSEGEVCVVDVTVDGGPTFHGEGLDLFHALESARLLLEARGLLLSCNGARRNVYPSSALRQMSNGRSAYVLTLPRTTTEPPVVDVLAAAPDSADLATVADQREWFERWTFSPDMTGE